MKLQQQWDETSGSCVHTFHEPKGFGQHLDWHPSGSCLGVGTSDSKVKVFDVRCMKLQQQYSVHEAPVNQVSFHPSGNYLVSASQDETIRIYDLLAVKPICTLYGHDKSVSAVTFSPQG